MIYILTAIKDRATDAFTPLGCARSEGEAIRNFQDIINNPQNGLLYNHPDDYDLYHMGDYDDTTGKINPSIPQKIADGKYLKLDKPTGV